MGSCWAKKACDYARSKIGEPCGGKGSPSEIVGEMDAVHFYNTLKNGEADSCSIFVDNCVYHGCTEPSCEEDPECAKWTALYMLNEPQSEGANEGAGCAQAVSYFQAMGEWYTDVQDYERGDKYFLKRASAVSGRNPLGVYHTGIIVDWGYNEDAGEDGFWCVEGNTNGGVVAEKFYTFAEAEKRWAGVGRPRYDGWSEDESSSGQVPVKDESSSSQVLTDAVIEDLARRCIEGEFGNYPLRKQKINALGYGPIYSKVQSRVNMIVYGR